MNIPNFHIIIVKMFFRFRNYESKLLFPLKNKLNIYCVDLSIFISIRKYKRFSEWLRRKRFYIDQVDGDDALYYLQNLSDIFFTIKIDPEEMTHERADRILGKSYRDNPLDTKAMLCLNTDKKYDGYIHNFESANHDIDPPTAIYDVIITNATYATINSCSTIIQYLKPICGFKTDHLTTYILPEFTRENPLILPGYNNSCSFDTDGEIICKRIEFNRKSDKKINYEYTMQITEDSCIVYTNGIFPEVYSGK